MWHLRKPSAPAIDEFLHRQQAEPFSYAEVGASLSGTPQGYNLDHNRVLLGKGKAVFDAACEGLRHWQMFPGPWTRIEPPNMPIREGTVVAILAQLFGVWWLNACRIVYVLNEQEPVRRYSFAYGTLPSHVECGEERFSIEWHPDDTVWYDLRAFSKPRHWLARLGYALTRRLQRRFVLDSQAAMREVVAPVVALVANSGN